MKKKGISPLIAAVLLIAFTMAVASIFAQWAPQLIQDAQGDSQQKADDIQRCYDRTMDVSVDNSTSEATVRQTGGNSGLGNLTVTWYYDSHDPTQNTTDQNNSLNSSRDIEVYFSGYPDRSITKVEVTPLNCSGAPTAEWTSS
ncbi:MAG: archaellin/type IV pilin N-terminal domain-containing protein [Candidatus Nanohaloarchaea archaeon]